MSILSFAFGAVLAVAGLLSVINGYGIVEIERGWTEVISGTVALAGGMVVMTLALVLHAIRDLRAKLAAGPASQSPPPVRAEPFADTPIPAAPLPPPLPDISPVPAMEAATRDVEAALFGAPQTREPAHVEPPEPEAPAPANPWQDLDEELARLDQEDPTFAPTTAPAVLEPMSAASSYAPTPEPPALEPKAEAEAPPPEPGLELPAVVGRYQADGTSYVMYADGAIEAHAPEGTYRFSSMAELKAFIEAKV